MAQQTMRQTYPHHPAEPLLLETSDPRSGVDRDMWKRVATNGHTTASERASHAALLAFLPTYQIDQRRFAVDQRALREISPFAVYFHKRRNPATLEPPSVWTDALVDEWLTDIFGTRDDETLWNPLTDGRPTINPWQHHKTPKMPMGTLGRDPFTDRKPKDGDCCKAGGAVFYTMELNSGGVPIIPVYKIKCRSNHYQAKSDILNSTHATHYQMASTLLQRWDHEEREKGILNNTDILRFYGRLCLWYHTLTPEEVEADKNLHPDHTPPHFDEIRSVLFEPRIIYPSLVDFNDGMANTFNGARNPTGHLGDAARVRQELAAANARINALTAQVGGAGNGELAAARVEVRRLQGVVSDKDEIIAGLRGGGGGDAALRAGFEDMTGQRDASDREAARLRVELENLRTGELATATARVAVLEGEVEQKNGEIQALRAGGGGGDGANQERMVELEAQVANKDTEIEQLSGRVQALESGDEVQLLQVQLEIAKADAAGYQDRLSASKLDNAKLQRRLPGGGSPGRGGRGAGGFGLGTPASTAG